MAVARPTRGRLSEVLTFPGEMRAERAVEVAAEVAGQVESVPVEMGDAVADDQLLAELDDTQLRLVRSQARAQARIVQAQLESARVQLENLEAEIDRSRSLLDRNLVSQQQFDSLEAERDAARAAVDVAEAQVDAAQATVRSADAELDRCEVTAPFAGRVAAVHVAEGAVVSPGMPLLRLVSSAELAMRLEVNEADVGRLRVGQPAEVMLSAHPGRPFPGHVARVGAEVEPASRAVSVDVVLNTAAPEVLAGMSGTVAIEIAATDDALIVPRAAVEVDAEGGQTVWVHDGGEAHRVSVETGLVDGERIEVRSGLSPDAEVIVRGQSLLREDGTAVIVREVAPW